MGVAVMDPRGVVMVAVAVMVAVMDPRGVVAVTDPRGVVMVAVEAMVAEVTDQRKVAVVAANLVVEVVPVADVAELQNVKVDIIMVQVGTLTASLRLLKMVKKALAVWFKYLSLLLLMLQRFRRREILLRNK